jgi:membrane glycosyltransferase
MIPDPTLSAPAVRKPAAPALPVALRRALVAALVAATTLAALALMVWTLSAGGFGWLDALITLCFAVTLPWAVIGFWNAVIGLALMRLTPDPARAVCPPLLDAADRSPITTRTALLSCIRNEDAATVGRNLDRMIDELAERGAATQFAVHVLSDSDWPEVIAAEEVEVARLTDRWRGVIDIHYRRRSDNAGYKAGNIREFCERRGADYDFALVLDADSLMAADTILRMVRTMQADTGLGILQTLMVGLPSASAFARPFQFGMRLGMKSYSLGAAWWQADAGPYWGHNALIRLRPFIDHCELPVLPGRGALAGWVLSHDQVEAALMRRAGYAVRVMPLEDGSWEENPPTLLEFIRRDLRWCQGNMQYLKLLGMPGLHPVSRVHLWLAILMFAASPAWVALMLIGVLRTGLDAPGPVFHAAPGLALFALIMTMIFAPKLATLIDALATADGRRRFGGSLRLLAGSVTEVLFSMLLAPIMAIAHSVFMGGLVFGRAVVWGPQRRAVHGVSAWLALRRLWPQTLLAAAAFGWMALFASAAALLFSTFFVGALLAVPLAVLSAWPALGAALAHIGLWRTPDEIAPAPTVAALHLPAMAAAATRPLPASADLVSNAAD